VNNAGIEGRTAPVSEVTDEDWQQIVAVNNFSANLLTIKWTKGF